MTRPRLALVITELAELNPGSPDGDFYSAWAREAVKRFDCTLIYAASQSPEDALFHDYQDRFLKEGICLESIREPSFDPIGSEAERRAQALYAQLRHASFEAIVFQDAGALGFFCAQAKRMGLAFSSTALWVLHDRPLESEFEIFDRLCSSFDDVQLMDLERRTFEYADGVISTLDGFAWAKKAGWKMPSRSQTLRKKRSQEKRRSLSSILKSKSWIFQDPFVSESRAEQIFQQIQAIPEERRSNLQVVFWLSRPDQVQVRTQNRLSARISQLGISPEVQSGRLDAGELLDSCPAFFSAPDLGFLKAVELEIPQDLVKKLPQSPQDRRKSRATLAVCLTHRNRPQFLEIAIQSLLAQTRPPDEIVVVDDASDQESAKAYLKVLERNTALRVIRQATRQGPERARNLAARTVKSAFLLFMDDDNVAKPNEVEVLLAVQARTDADVLVCGLDRFYGDAPDAHLTSKIYRWLPTSGDLNQALLMSPIGDTNALLRKSTFLELGGFDENPEYAWEDFDLYLRAILAGKNFQTCPEALCWYRKHSENRTLELPVPATLRHRLKTLPRIAGQDLRPYFSLFHGLMDRDQERYWRITDRRLVSPERTDLARMDRKAVADRQVVRGVALKKLEVEQAWAGFKGQMLQLKPSGRNPIVRLPHPKRLKNFKIRVEVHAAQESWMGFRYESSELTGGPVTQEHRLKRGSNILEFRCDRPSQNSHGLQMLLASDGAAIRIRTLEYLATTTR